MCIGFLVWTSKFYHLHRQMVIHSSAFISVHPETASSYLFFGNNLNMFVFSYCFIISCVNKQCNVLLAAAGSISGMYWNSFIDQWLLVTVIFKEFLNYSSNVIINYSAADFCFILLLSYIIRGYTNPEEKWNFSWSRSYVSVLPQTSLLSRENL